MLLEVMSRDMQREAARLKWFLYFCVSVLIGAFADAVSYLADGRTENMAVLFIANFLSYTVINVSMLLFGIYVMELAREEKNKKARYRNIWIVVVLAAVNICLETVGTITGKLFVIEDGLFVAKEWDSFSGAIPALCFLLLCYVLARNIKRQVMRRFVVIAAFIIVPVCQSFVVAAIPEIQFSYATSAVVCEIIYIFIQNQAVSTARVREEIMKRVSSTDMLTGFKNRRGYEEILECCAKAGGKLGAVFCDMNGLKYTNDNFGHAAGDAYIVRVAELLRRVFGEKANICRISGDEFVILLPGEERSEIERLAGKLKAEIAENDRIAAYGFAYGEDRPPLELLHEAEQEMYRDKSDYYKQTGRDRRG